MDNVIERFRLSLNEILSTHEMEYLTSAESQTLLDDSLEIKRILISTLKTSKA